MQFVESGLGGGEGGGECPLDLTDREAASIYQSYEEEGEDSQFLSDISFFQFFKDLKAEKNLISNIDMIDKIDGNKEKKFKSMNNRTFFLFPEAHNWLQSFIPLLKLLAEYC